MSGKVEFQKWITRQDLRDNPDKYYVFGDNCVREGFGGQAKEMRGEPNAIGVRTKFSPDRKPSSYFTDCNMCAMLILDDFKDIYQLINKGKTIVFPLDGLGTGLSLLPEKAPELHKMIERLTSFVSNHASKDDHENNTYFLPSLPTLEQLRTW